MSIKDVTGEQPYNSEGVPSPYIRFKGVWDMDDLYKIMVDHFHRRKWKFHEKVYKHKHPSPFGVERQYVWMATRNESDFLKFTINVYFHTYDAHDVDVVLADGSKKVFTKGRLWMEFRGEMSYDWAGNFSKSTFLLQLRNFYNKYIIKKRREQQWWDKLWYVEIHQLRLLVIRRLKMQEDAFEHRDWQGVHQGV